jgi:uncharacterized membrane protein YbhN (UPF0104 family)
MRIFLQTNWTRLVGALFFLFIALTLLQLPWVAGCAGTNISLSLREPIRVSELFVFHTLDPL